MRHTYHTHGWFDFFSSAPSLIKENDVVDAWDDLVEYAKKHPSIMHSVEVSAENFEKLPPLSRRRVVEHLQDYRDEREGGPNRVYLAMSVDEFGELEFPEDFPVPEEDPATQEILAAEDPGTQDAPVEDPVPTERISIPDPVVQPKPEPSAPTSTPKKVESRAAEGSSPRWVQYSVAGVYGIALIALARRISRS